MEAAFRETRRRWLGYLGRWIHDRHRAEDALQDLWVEALESGLIASGGSASERAADRLGRLVPRVASRVRRRFRPLRADELERIHAERSVVDRRWIVDGRAFTAEEVLVCVRAELDALGERDGALLRRRYEDRRPASAMAREVGLSRDAVQSRLKRGRVRLREAVARRLRAREVEPRPEELSRAVAPDGPERARERGVVR